MTTHRKIKTINPTATHNSVSVAGMGACWQLLLAVGQHSHHAALLAQLPSEGQAAIARV